MPGLAGVESEEGAAPKRIFSAVDKNFCPPPGVIRPMPFASGDRIAVSSTDIVDADDTVGALDFDGVAKAAGGASIFILLAVEK